MTSPLDALGAGFVPTLVTLSKQVGVDPLGACAVMLYESGLQASIVNSIGCVGVFQACSASSYAPLTTAQYRQLTAAQQLPYAFRFWQSMIRAHGQGQTFFDGRDLYWINILPGTYVSGASDNFRIPFTAAQYAANRGLDHGGKGYISPGDFTIALNGAIRNHPALWNALVTAIGPTASPVAAISPTSTLVAVSVLGALVGAAAFLAADL